jgi:TIR domain
MRKKIFISYSKADNLVVENTALRLEKIVSREEIFYDKWSIRPGDGIIDKIGEGLEAPEVFLFFLSKNSIGSYVAGLEWKNALFSAVRTNTRFVPVRLDDSIVPALLRQTNYIDMHEIGMEKGIETILKVIKGESTFVPQYHNQSNLTFSLSHTENGDIDVKITAQVVQEISPVFALLTRNNETEFGTFFSGGTLVNSSFFTDQHLGNGHSSNALVVRPTLTIKPGLSFTIRMSPRGTTPVSFEGLYKQITENEYTPIPRIQI